MKERTRSDYDGFDGSLDEIWAVKLADRICNLYAPPFYWSNDKKRAYLEEAKLIHAALKEGNVYLANRLALKIQEYQRFIV